MMRRGWIVASVLLGVLVLAGVGVAVSGAARTTPVRHAKLVPRVAGRPRVRAARAAPGSSSSPVSASEAAASEVPAGSWNLPAPTKTEGIVGLGYPDSVLGAVALGFNFLSAGEQVNPSLAASVVQDAGYDPTPAEEQHVYQTIEATRAHYGIPPTGPTPDTIDLSLVACKVISVSPLAPAAPQKVLAGYEGVLVVEGPGIEGGSYDIALEEEMVWTGSDWRVVWTPLPSLPVRFPGQPGATAAGWHPCGQE
ncbi:hypothetical protein ACFFRE_02095 [Aciditerrimonas ferrireducens]|uniref:Uncharacterized protein n=1 Tax=Aciditerrimonas ferrireducens TaxID=667306 RepID=A0ABV6BZU5_9ACTN